MTGRLAIAIEIGATLKGAAKAAFASTEKTGRRLNTVMGNLEAKAGAVAAWKRQTEATKNARDHWDKAKKTAKDLAAEVAKTEKPSKKLTKELERARAKAKTAAAAIRDQSAALRSSNRALKDAGFSTANLASETAALDRRMKEIAAKRSALGSAIAARDAAKQRRQQLRGEALEIAGLAIALGAPIVRAIQFEDKMADVRKVAGWTKDETNAFGRSLLDLSAKKLPITAAGLAEIASAAKEAGIIDKELKPFITTASKASIAWGMAAGEVGETFSGWRASMNLTQERAFALADATNHLSNSIAASAPDISRVLLRQGALAIQSGLLETKTAALAAAMLASKQPAEVVGTAMKSMLGSLTGGPALTDREAQALRRLGFGAQEMAQMMQDDAERAILDVLEAIGNLDDVERPAVMSDLFGDESITAVASLVENLDGLRRSFDLVSDQTKYAGSMQEEFATRMETTGAGVKLARGQLDRMATNIGSVLLPAVNDVLGVFGAVGDTLASLNESFPAFTKAIVFGTTALIGYKVAKFAVRYAIEAIKAPFLDARVMYRRLGAEAAMSGSKVGGFARRTRWASLAVRRFSVSGMVSGLRSIGGAARGVRFGGLVGGLSSLLRFAGPLKKIFSLAKWGFRALRIAATATPIGAIINGLILAAELVILNWEKVWSLVKPAAEWIQTTWNGLFGNGDDGEPKKAPIRHAEIDPASPAGVTAMPDFRGVGGLPGFESIPPRPDLGLAPGGPEIGPVGNLPGDGSGGFGQTAPILQVAAPAGGSRTVNSSPTFNVTINAPDGADAEAIADLVMERLKSATGSEIETGLYDEAGYG